MEAPASVQPEEPAGDEGMELEMEAPAALDPQESPGDEGV
jgi:hypothetical protein